MTFLLFYGATILANLAFLNLKYDAY